LFQPTDHHRKEISMAKCPHCGKEVAFEVRLKKPKAAPVTKKAAPVKKAAVKPKAPDKPKTVAAKLKPLLNKPL
jgi:hypothetical protein